MDEQEIEWFLQHITLINSSKGHLLFQSGDSAKHMYIITEGWVKLYYNNRDGEETVQGILTRGDTFGEECAFEEYDYTYNAEIVSPTATCMLIEGERVRNKLRQNPAISLKMLTAFAHRLHQTGLMYDHFTKLTAAQRVAAFLLKLSMDRGYTDTVTFPYNKLLVASRLCMRPETFSRALRRLESDLGLNIKRRVIKIHDLNQLEDYCEIYCNKDVECSLENKLACSNRRCDLFRLLNLM